MMVLIRVAILFLVFFLSEGMLSAETEREKIERILPHNTKIESFKFDRNLGFYEVISEGKVFYLTEDLRHLIIGNIIDLRTMRNLTADKIREIRKVDFESLPKKDAIRVAGGKRAIAVFTDPDCSYCKKLHAELGKVRDVSIFVFLYPISEEGRKKSVQIWCSGDQVKALDMALNGGKVGGNLCGEHPVDRNLTLGKKLFITGTPTTITDRGDVINGYVRAETILEVLNRESK